MKNRVKKTEKRDDEATRKTIKTKTNKDGQKEKDHDNAATANDKEGEKRKI